MKKNLSIVAFGLLVEMTFNGLLPMALRYLIDGVTGASKAASISGLLMFLALGAVAASVAGFWRDRTWARTQAMFLARLRQQMFDHLQVLSIGFFQGGSGGGVLSRFSSDLSTIENAGFMAIPWGLLPAVECLFSSALLFALDWKIWLAAMTLWPWTIMAPRLFTSRARRTNALRREAEATLLSELQENLAVQPVVKAFGLETLRMGAFAKRNAAWTESASEAGFANALLERSTTSGILLIQVAVLGLGAWMAFHRRITLGTLVSSQALLLLLSNNLLYVMQYLPSLLQARAAMARIDHLLGIAPQVQEEQGARPAPQNIRDIEFRDVSFAYPGGSPVLHGVSLRIPAGASVAFVGGSGSGKSTMLNLLMRFYDPTGGSVLVNGEDVLSFSLGSWRARMGAVFQESLLFNLPLAENIRMAGTDADDAQVHAAASGAEIHDFIQGLPEGYATPAGERGSRLSGGQRQRVSIARAILRNPAILVLDEATSALDPVTESAINATLARLGWGRTCISVTHRLASAAAADLIFVFDAGRLVESGAHDELLAKRGHYAALWNKQHGFSVSGDGASVSIRPERLAEIPILSGLAPDDLAAIAPLFLSETFRNGEQVIAEGDASGSFYIVVRGRLEVVRMGARIAVLDDGDYFGEISLLTGSPRTATVRALSESTCIVLSKESFDALLARSPGLRGQMSRVASERLQAGQVR